MKKKPAKKKKPIKKVKRVDPLHVPSAKLVVNWQGEERFILNKALLDQQNCWHNLELIKELHKTRLDLELKMSKTDFTVPLHIRRQNHYDWVNNQFELQKAWGFDQDARFHKFWEVKGCLCPKLDNMDAYPAGYYVTTSGCPLHADE